MRKDKDSPVHLIANKEDLQKMQSRLKYLYTDLLMIS